MKIDKTTNYTHLKPSQKAAQNFLSEIKNKYSDFENDHLIIDFSENLNTKIDEILLFLELSASHKKNKLSFIIICENIDSDNVPEQINVVPTLTEALDILEMDAIERDLGF
jgi:hypothetical protein